MLQFLSIRDVKEAEQCVREMLLDARQEALVVETAVNDSYDLQKEEERASVRDVITHLASEGCVSSDAIVQGLKVGRPCRCRSPLRHSGRCRCMLVVCGRPPLRKRRRRVWLPVGGSHNFHSMHTPQPTRLGHACCGQHACCGVYIHAYVAHAVTVRSWPLLAVLPQCGRGQASAGPADGLCCSSAPLQHNAHFLLSLRPSLRQPIIRMAR